jgi:DNA-binding beta-propeller fold protein YncE
MTFPIRATVLLGFSLAFTALTLYSCRHERIAPESGYPSAIANIIINRCTTGPGGGGCHNAIGAENSNGLRLDTWAGLFDGTTHGAAVIPYDVVNSEFLHVINIDSSLGLVSEPTMPLEGAPLSRAEYIQLRDWIAAGAPDKNGNIAFADNPDTRQKIYMTMQGSDMLSVVATDKHVVMRNIPIGETNTIESPHCVRLSKDGRYAYVSFYAGDYVQKIDTRTDQVVGKTQISNGDAQWNILHVSDDGTKVIVADFKNGNFKFINTATMSLERTITSNGLFTHPHGIDANPTFDTIYVTAQYGNTVYKIFPTSFKRVSIDGAPTTTSDSSLNPHEIKLTPDGSKYFLTCEHSNEVRVLNARTDEILAAIPVPEKPQELALSHTKPYMFVTCMEAIPLGGGTKGAIVVINYNTLEVVKTIWGPFFQPHGIAVDDQAGTFYVASVNLTGPSSGHDHTGNKHGWYNVYDLNTLELVNTRQYETLVQPYSLDSRMK